MNKNEIKVNDFPIKIEKFIFFLDVVITFSTTNIKIIIINKERFKERLSGPLTDREKTFLQKDSRRL